MTTLTALSLGAGVQSTTLALLAEEGVLPKPDVAIFADTGWEPREVYEHLDRLEAALSFPVLRVSDGSIRDLLLNQVRDTTVSVPFHLRDLRDPSAGPGIAARQCTQAYKIAPIRRKIRELLGASPPSFRRVPNGRVCEQWVGFSTDEVGRANRRRDSAGVRYMTTRYPLLDDLDMSRKDCTRWLDSRGWASVAKSVCIGCPFKSNRMWRDMRDGQPEAWADAVLVDEQIRLVRPGSVPAGAEPYLHRSLLPLSVAPVDRVPRREWRDRQGDIFDAVADADAEEDGCSPYGCRSGPQAS